MDAQHAFDLTSVTVYGEDEEDMDQRRIEQKRRCYQRARLEGTRYIVERQAYRQRQNERPGDKSKRCLSVACSNADDQVSRNVCVSLLIPS